MRRSLAADRLDQGIVRGAAWLRWVVPGALLLAEYLTLSFLVDFPETGPAMGLIGAARLAVPVFIGAGAAGLLLTRRDLRPMLEEMSASLPAWRPWPALAAHLAAFVGTAVFAHRLFREGSPPVTALPLFAWFGCVAGTALLALMSAAPLRWIGSLVAIRWRVPVLAAAVGLLSWRVAAAAEGLWGVLSAMTLRSSAWLLSHVGEVTIDPVERMIGLDGFEVLVAPICSGVDGVGMVVFFQAIWISLARARLRLSRACLLLPLGAIAALTANVLRISTLVWVGASGREALALGGLHSKLGWLLFVAIALGSVAVAERVTWLRRPDAAAADGAGEERGVPQAAAAYLAPLLAALAAALVSSIWSEGAFDRAYGVRILAALAVLFLVRKSLPRPSLSWSWVPWLLAAAVLVLWVPFAGGDGRTLTDGLARLQPIERWGWIVTRVIGSCVVIPVVEELAIRGFLLPWLVSPHFESVSPRAWTWPAVLLSSLAFGAIHQQWLLGTAAGIAFAAARLYRGRLGDAILAHGLCNAVIAAAVLLGGRWDLWG